MFKKQDDAWHERLEKRGIREVTWKDYILEALTDVDFWTLILFPIFIIVGLDILFNLFIYDAVTDPSWLASSIPLTLLLTFFVIRIAAD